MKSNENLIYIFFNLWFAIDAYELKVILFLSDGCSGQEDVPGYVGGKKKTIKCRLKGCWEIKRLSLMSWGKKKMYFLLWNQN